MKYFQVLSVICLFLLAGFSSCVDTKKAAYFYGINDTAVTSQYSKIPEPIITQNDILTISVSSANPQADIPFNAPNTMATTSGAGLGQVANQTTGFLVNAQGVIQYPVLGNIKVGGMTKDAVKDMITRELLEKKLLIDPVVSIRIINFRVTVMGEVRTPGVVTIPSEKLSLLEALGMAGDLTVFAKRDNILLIREDNGKKVIKRINLNSQDLFDSEYYYLKSNDIIYAEANAARLSSADRSWQILPVVLSGVSVLAVVVGLLVR